MPPKTGKSFRSILDSLDSDQQRKLSEKAPVWAGTQGVTIPGKLSLEQCSSQAAALYKASLSPDGDIADLTSGLGIDVWAFARKNRESKVYYNDISEVLCEAARKNFPLLGIDNVEISNLSAEERLSSLGQVGMIFLDPARRDVTGKKVFRLEDCSPNVLELLPECWKHSRTVMMKLSPMVDLTMLERQLPMLSEIHVIGSGNECKEIICILRKDFQGLPELNVVLLGKDVSRLELGTSDDRERAACSGIPAVGDILMEPSAALAKSGRYNRICRMFGLSRLGESVNLFKMADSQAACGQADGFFKTYRVLEVAGYGRQTFREIGARYPKADVSTKNLPIRSEDLKKKMGITGSGDVHIFALGLNPETIVVTERLRSRHGFPL